MNTEGFKRKLSAVLSADVAGYSRLMGADDEATVHTLTGHREMISAIIRQHQGRVVDSPGDNLLAEFESVLQCVDCSLEIQRELAERNAELPDERKLEYRIGVNVGDVIKEGDRIYGDGVNIAARLESIAEPGGICISGMVYTHVKNKLKLDYEYLGKRTMKNISEPVPVYRILSFPAASAVKVFQAEKKAQRETTGSHFSNKPSIAVLPFVNMSHDPEQEYFSDGMTEEIIGALAKLEGLKVISRTSAFHFKGKDANLRTIGEMLNVDHVLEGSVRRANNRIRISAQLIKVADDTHSWAETYDRELEDVFAVQDEISQAVVASLKEKLLGTRTEPLVKAYAENKEAYELFLKANYFENRADFKKAIEYLEKAIHINPAYAPAYCSLAHAYGMKGMQESLPPWQSKQMENELLKKALELDENYGFTYFGMARLKMCEYEWSTAEKYCKRAIKLNPGLSAPHFGYSVYLACVGRIAEAITKAKYALELDPLDSYGRFMLTGLLIFDRQLDQAIQASKATLELDENNINGLAGLAGVYTAKQNYAKAISILKRLAHIPVWAASLGYVLGKAGEKEAARKILDGFLDQHKKGYFSPYYIAWIYNGLGETDKAFEWLDRAYDVQDPLQMIIKVDHTFSALHSDPRWPEVLKKRNLAG